MVCYWNREQKSFISWLSNRTIFLNDTYLRGLGLAIALRHILQYLFNFVFLVFPVFCNFYTSDNSYYPIFLINASIILLGQRIVTLMCSL